MKTTFPWFWILQSLIFLALTILMAVFPKVCLDGILGVPWLDDDSWHLAREQTILTSPHMLAVALFTLLGVISPSSRVSLARHLTFILLLAGLALALSWWNDVDLPRALIVGTGLGALTAMNAHYWYRNACTEPPLDDAGIAVGRPPQLWMIWFAQYAVFSLLGLAYLFIPEWLLQNVTWASLDITVLDDKDTVFDCMRMGAPWILGLGLMTGFAMGMRTDRIWKSSGWIFVLCHCLFVLVGVYAIAKGQYAVWGLIIYLLPVIFIFPTVFYIGRTNPWFAENVERYDGWALSDLILGIPLLVKTLVKGRRPLNPVGVGARGQFEVNSKMPEDVPYHAALLDETGTTARGPFEVVARFSNQTLEDDAGLDARGLAFSIRDSQGLHNFDMLLSTGSFSPATDIWSFLFRVPGLMPRFLFKRVLRRSQEARDGNIACLRRAPDSYAGLAYYSQLVWHWPSPHDVRHLVRFRMKPPEAKDGPPPRKGAGTSHDSEGLPDEVDVAQLWQRNRRKDEARPLDYLRCELRDRFNAKVSVKFRLEAQFHKPARLDSEEWYNPSVEWDHGTHKWQHLGTVTLDRLMWESEAEALEFRFGRTPWGVGVPKARGIFDYRSLAACLSRVMPAVQSLRRWRCGGLRRVPESKITRPAESAVAGATVGGRA